jgi:hypothetical protein
LVRRRRRGGRSFLTLALLGALSLTGFRAQAQCTLAAAPKSFEPNPPGPGNPRPTYLSSGFNNNLALYRNGSNGPRRLLMQESYGYSVLDLTSPASPSVLRYNDMRFSQVNPITAHGDGQSYIQTIAVSADGARAAFSMTNNGVPPWNTVAGSPDGSEGFTMWGDFLTNKASGTVLQHIGNRYIAYDVHPFLGATAVDVTNLPGSLNALNMASESTSWPAGSFPSLAGNFLVYMSGSVIQVVDASNPGPAGNITGAFPKTTITSADFGGRAPLYYAAAVDPTDANKLWVLAELAALPGQIAPSYGLVSLTKGFAAPPQSAGAPFPVPSSAGDWFPNVGYASALVPSNGSLFVLMWARRVPAVGATQFLLYSTTAAAWASATPASFAVSGPGFALPSTMAGFGEPGTNNVYAYVPTTVSAYVIPMTCVPLNAPAAALVAVANQAGAPLNSGDTLFVGDQITVSPSAIPAPASQPLTGFGWRFDFDFHAGAASEDNGPAASPRLAASDNAAFGGAPLPFPVTVVGPCDYRAPNTTLSTGAGCWNSVTANGAFGGPDFPAAPAPGSTVALAFAFEANNQYGSAGASLFTLNWKIPAARVQSTQILTGDSLVSVSDGHPTAQQWSFGPDAQHLAASCAAASCAPPAPYNTKGTYAYSLTAKYYADQAFTATASGTYTVTNLLPKFLVNNSAADQINVQTGQLIPITNQSTKGAGVTGSYSYSLCQIPGGQTTCAAGAYTAWPAMTDAPSTAAIPMPSPAGSWLLRIHVTTSNPAGQEDWTPNTGAPDPMAFRLTVVDVVPVINVWVNGVDPCFVAPGPGGGSGGCTPNQSNPFTANVGDSLLAYSYVNGVREPSGSASFAWDFGSPTAASPSTGSVQGAAFTYTQGGVYQVRLTRNGIAAPGQATGTITAFPPVTAVASVAQAWVYPGNPASFSCAGAGGNGILTYAWNYTGGGSDSIQNPSHAFGAPGAVSATCVVHDSRGASSPPSAAPLTVVPAAGSGPTTFHTITPCRLLDTRNTAGPLGGPSIGASGSADRVFTAAGACGIPADARSIVTNVSVTNVGAAGDLAVFGGNDSANGTSAISFHAGATKANNSVIRLATDGSGTIRAHNNAPAPLDLIVDVSGYYK